MKRIASIACTLAVLAPLTAAPAMAAGLSGTDKRILAALAEATAVSAESKGSVWPGFDLSTHPYVIYDKNRVAFLFNHPHPPAGFAPLPGAPGHLKGHVAVHWGGNGLLDRSKDLTVNIAGTRTAFLPYEYMTYSGKVSPKDLFAPLFAAYTQQAFGTFPELQRIADTANRDYPSSNSDNTAMANLEDKILAVAVQAKEPDKLKEYSKFFVAVRETRQKALPNKIARFETLSESLEGAMRYTETELSAFGASGHHHATAGATWIKEEEALKEVVGMLMQPPDSEELRKSRFSATGTAMGVVMDRLGNTAWKGQVTAGQPIETVFAKTVGYDASEAESLVKSAKQIFDFDKIAAESKDLTTRFPTDYKEFLKNPGTKFVVTGLAKVADNGSNRIDPTKPGGEWIRLGSPTPPIEVDSHTLLAYRMNQFDYRHGKVTVTLKDTPMLMRSNNLSWPFENVTFFSDDKNLRATIDGKDMALTGGSYSFSRGLRLGGQNIMIEASQGVLKVNGKNVTLTIKR